jgi:hypothetical protein
MKRPEEVTLSREEGEALIERLHRDALTAEDRRVLVKVLTFYFWLLFALREAKLSLKRLKTLVFGEKPKKREPPESGGSTGGSGGAGGAGRGPAASVQVASVRERGPAPASERRPGHGRQRADVYQEVKRVECRHEELAVGERCPACGRGRLYRLPGGLRCGSMALRGCRRCAMSSRSCAARPVGKCSPRRCQWKRAQRRTVRGHGRCER